MDSGPLRSKLSQVNGKNVNYLFSSPPTPKIKCDTHTLTIKGNLSSYTFLFACIMRARKGLAKVTVGI